MACYANQELFDIMTSASDTMTACHDNPGQYPNGKTAGPAFCLFDQLGFVSIFWQIFLGLKFTQNVKST